MATACRYQAGPQLSSRAGREKRRSRGGGRRQIRLIVGAAYPWKGEQTLASKHGRRSIDSYHSTIAINDKLAEHRRPRHGSAKPRDELSASHSITSSAVASRASGIVTPRMLAVFRLMTSFTLAVC
jgi:hypothetical protein